MTSPLKSDFYNLFQKVDDRYTREIALNKTLEKNDKTKTTRLAAHSAILSGSQYCIRHACIGKAAWPKWNKDAPQSLFSAEVRNTATTLIGDLQAMKEKHAAIAGTPELIDPPLAALKTLRQLADANDPKEPAQKEVSTQTMDPPTKAKKSNYFWYAVAAVVTVVTVGVLCSKRK